MVGVFKWSKVCWLLVQLNWTPFKYICAVILQCAGNLHLKYFSISIVITGVDKLLALGGHLAIDGLVDGDILLDGICHC